MKFAAIVPPSGLRILERVGLGYHLCLAQELLRDKTYREYYKILGRMGHFVIVDNGAAERDTPPFSEVVKVANYVSASEIVMPDVVLDKDATLAALFDSKALDLVPARMRFVVPQGRTPQEWGDCLKAINDHMEGRYATIGLSKYHHVPFGAGGRSQVFAYMPRWLRERVNIHVLGIATNDPLGEITALAAADTGIRGVDTAAPVAYAQRFRSLPDEVPPEVHLSVAWDAPFDIALATKNVLRFAREVSRL